MDCTACTARNIPCTVLTGITWVTSRIMLALTKTSLSLPFLKHDWKMTQLFCNMAAIVYIGSSVGMNPRQNRTRVTRYVLAEVSSLCWILRYFLG